MSEQVVGGYSLRQGTRRSYKEMNEGQKYRLPSKRKTNHRVGHYKLKRPRGGIPPGQQGSSVSPHDATQSPSTDLNPFIINSTIVSVFAMITIVEFHVHGLWICSQILVGPLPLRMNDSYVTYTI